MTKNKFKKHIDISMFLAIYLLIGTGLLLEHRLVPGFRGVRGLSMLGLDRHEWGAIHLWTGYILISLLIVHLYLNYTFVFNVIALKRFSILISLLFMGLLILLAFLLIPLDKTTAAHRGNQRHNYHTTALE